MGTNVAELATPSYGVQFDSQVLTMQCVLFLILHLNSPDPLSVRSIRIGRSSKNEDGSAASHRVPHDVHKSADMFQYTGLLYNIILCAYRHSLSPTPTLEQLWDPRPKHPPEYCSALRTQLDMLQATCRNSTSSPCLRPNAQNGIQLRWLVPLRELHSLARYQKRSNEGAFGHGSMHRPLTPRRLGLEALMQAHAMSGNHSRLLAATSVSRGFRSGSWEASWKKKSRPSVVATCSEIWVSTAPHLNLHSVLYVCIIRRIDRQRPEPGAHGP